MDQDQPPPILRLPVKVGRSFPFRREAQDLVALMSEAGISAVSFGCHARGHEGAALSQIRFWRDTTKGVIPIPGSEISPPLLDHLLSGHHPLALEDPFEIIETDGLCDHILTPDGLAVSSFSAPNIDFEIEGRSAWRDLHLGAGKPTEEDIAAMIDALENGGEHTLALHPREPCSAHATLRGLAALAPSLTLLRGILGQLSGLETRMPGVRLELLWP